MSALNYARGYWSDEETELLKRIYHRKLSMIDISEILFRPDNCIWAKAQKLNLKRAHKIHHGSKIEFLVNAAWSPEDISCLRFIKNYFPEMKPHFLMKIFLRSNEEIEDQWRQMTSNNIVKLNNGTVSMIKQIPTKDSDLATILEMLNEHIKSSSKKIDIFTDEEGRVRARVIEEVVY